VVASGSQYRTREVVDGGAVLVGGRADDVAEPATGSGHVDRAEPVVREVGDVRAVAADVDALAADPTT